MKKTYLNIQLVNWRRRKISNNCYIKIVVYNLITKNDITLNYWSLTNKPNSITNEISHNQLYLVI